MRHFSTALMLAAFAIAGCSGSTEGEPRSRQGWVPDGDPVRCITIRQIRSTHVIDDRTIHFVMNNRLMFRNELPTTCPGLGFSRAFAHNSRTSQLCSVDTITVVQAGGGVPGARCGLGMFQPMKPAAPATPAPSSGG